MNKTMRKSYITFILSFGMAISSVQSFAQNFDRADVAGKLHGKLQVPPNTDLSSVIIQVIGANQKDNFIYYTVPNADGEFNFDGILPAESVVQLYIWDGSGMLNNTTLSAYVAKAMAKEVPVYQVTMTPLQYVQDLASIYQTPHDMTRTGFCGFVSHFSHKDDQNLKISAYDRYAKSAGPLFVQNLDQKDRFCFFNLYSLSGTDMYDFVVTGQTTEDERKTFTLYLPPTTFVDNAFLDAQSALYRPITPYSWQEDTVFPKQVQWQKLKAVNLSTSDDHSFVTYDAAKPNTNLFYFPLSNELLEVSYFLNGENSEHFFFLLPRTQLFDAAKINPAMSHYTDRIYIDYNNPLPIKFVTEHEMMNFNSNYYFQTWNEKFGSVFVHIDLSQFGIKDSSEIKVSLRNIAGQDIGNFEEIITAQEQHLLGFFLDLFPGRYQIFLTNLKNELLWTYEIRSYPNRIQLLTNEWALPKDSTPHKTQPIDEEPIAITEIENYHSMNTMDPIKTDFLNKIDRVELQKEKIYLHNNTMFQYSDSELCHKSNPKSFIENLVLNDVSHI